MVDAKPEDYDESSVEKSVSKEVIDLDCVSIIKTKLKGSIPVNMVNVAIIMIKLWSTSRKSKNGLLK